MNLKIAYLSLRPSYYPIVVHSASRKLAKSALSDNKSWYNKDFTTFVPSYQELPNIPRFSHSSLTNMVRLLDPPTLLFDHIKQTVWIKAEIGRVKAYTYEQARTLCISTYRNCYRAAIILRTGRDDSRSPFIGSLLARNDNAALNDAGPQATTDVTICSNHHISERTVPGIYSSSMTSHGLPAYCSSLSFPSAFQPTARMTRFVNPFHLSSSSFPFALSATDSTFHIRSPTFQFSNKWVNVYS